MQGSSAAKFWSSRIAERWVNAASAINAACSLYPTSHGVDARVVFGMDLSTTLGEFLKRLIIPANTQSPNMIKQILFTRTHIHQTDSFHTRAGKHDWRVVACPQVEAVLQEQVCVCVCVFYYCAAVAHKPQMSDRAR